MSQTKLSSFFAVRSSDRSREIPSASGEPQRRTTDSTCRNKAVRGKTNSRRIVGPSGTSIASSLSSLPKSSRSTKSSVGNAKLTKSSKSTSSRAKHPRLGNAAGDRSTLLTTQQTSKKSSQKTHPVAKDPVRLHHERILTSLEEEFGIPALKTAKAAQSRQNSRKSKNHNRQQPSRPQTGGKETRHRANPDFQHTKEKNMIKATTRLGPQSAHSDPQLTQRSTEKGFRLASGRPLTNQRSISQEHASESRAETLESSSDSNNLSAAAPVIESSSANQHDETLAVDGQQSSDSTKREDSEAEAKTASQSSNELHSQDRKKQKTKNTLCGHVKGGSSMDWILQRSLTGIKKPFDMPKRLSIPWKATPWLYLQNISNASSIRHMCWDDEGVLFAVLLDQTLIIYDWDSATAADRKGRNAHARKKALAAIGEIEQTSSCFCVAPILSIRLPASFSTSSSNLGCLSVHWNPHNPDEIALLHLNGNVCIYDLGSVLAWQDTQRDSMAESWSTNTRAPHKIIRLDQSMTGHSNGHLLFVSATHLIIATGNEVACYSVPKNASSAKKLLWKWNWQTVTSVIAVSSRQILLGSKNGKLVLVDWKRSQKPAFSSKPIPTVMAQWSTTATFSKSSFPNHVGGMGVFDLQTQSSKSYIASERCPRVLQLSWRTPSGWALKAQLDSCDLKLSHTFVFKATAPVKVLNHRGEETQMDHSKRKWSLPADGKMIGCGTFNSLVWTKVAKVTQILPHHDHRVMVSGAQAGQVNREKLRPTLLFYNRLSGQLQEIAISSKSQSWPTTLAIHPSQEWLIAADDVGNLRILNARGR